MKREDAVLYAGIADALNVLGRAEPKIGRPYFNAEFAPQKDGRRGPPAAKIQHSQAGAQVQRRRKPLSNPEGIRTPTGIGLDPIGVISRSTRESVGN
jgi:hypothetical protein